MAGQATVDVASLEADPLFKEVRVQYLKKGIAIERGGLYIRDNAGAMALSQAIAETSNDTSAPLRLFFSHYKVPSEVVLGEQSLTRLKVPAKDIMKVQQVMRGAGAQFGLQADADTTALAGHGASEYALSYLVTVQGSLETKCAIWLMSGAPMLIGPPGSKVRSLLPVKNLLQAPIRDIARTTAETPEHAIFECTIRIPKSAVGRIIGTKGSSKKVLEQQLGEEFQLESVLDPAVPCHVPVVHPTLVWNAYTRSKRALRTN